MYTDRNRGNRLSTELQTTVSTVPIPIRSPGPALYGKYDLETVSDEPMRLYRLHQPLASYELAVSFGFLSGAWWKIIRSSSSSIARDFIALQK